MAIDVKALLADALLELCEQKPLSKISVSDIQAQSGVSRQAFYNHFRDKQDLIQYIYLNRIIVEWADPDVDFPYYDALLKTFRRYIRYQRFLKQAILLTGQNCLADFMTDYCIEFDKTWHQRCYGHADAGRPVSGHGVPLACGHDHDDLVDPVGHAGVPGLHHGHDHQNARRRPEPHALPARR